MALARGEQIAESFVRRPPALLQPYVESYVGYHYAGFSPGEHRGLPSRHLTFVISFDGPLNLSVLPDGTRPWSSFDALLGGFHTTPAVISHDGNQHGIQLQVTPAGARALFGLPAGELASSVVPLDAVWGKLAMELLDRLDGVTSWAERFAVLEGLLFRALTTHVEIPSGAARPEAAQAWRRLVATAGQVDVATLAADVGWSRRHLSERFAAEFGVGPKAMARVLRFERARWMIIRRERLSLAEIAAECGYADQAHMTREFQALAGASPRAWLANEHLPFVQDEDSSGGPEWSS
jgi:AraC-like DNA-binding protein